MKKTIIIVILLLCIVCASIAETCDREVIRNGERTACGYSIKWCSGEPSYEENKTHTYTTGFLGLGGTHVCSYNQRKMYYHYECSNPDSTHVNNMSIVIQERGHSCGKEWDYYYLFQ